MDKSITLVRGRTFTRIETCEHVHYVKSHTEVVVGHLLYVAVKIYYQSEILGLRPRGIETILPRDQYCMHGCESRVR